MRPLLIPIDFSDCTHGLVDYAVDLAARLGAGLVLLHVADAPASLASAQLGEGETGGALLAQESRDLLDGFAERARRGGAAVETALRWGRPGESILDAAAERDPSMIVMGTRGRRGVLRAALGSVAEYVVRRADAPVVTVRTQRRPECGAASCAVCASHLTPVREQLAAELDG